MYYYLETVHIFLPLYFGSKTSLDDSYGKSEVSGMCKNRKFWMHLIKV